MSIDIWTYREAPDGQGPHVIGYDVEALDGEIGKIDEATNEVGTSYIVVDTGHWIFGKKVMLPAGIVSRVDVVHERVYVDRTKDQIKNAPDDDPHFHDDAYRNQLGSYYGRGGAGWREP
jgi:hypothetical protein